MYTVKCPHCMTILSAETTQLGEVARCPSCGLAFAIEPSLESSTQAEMIQAGAPPPVLQGRVGADESFSEDFAGERGGATEDDSEFSFEEARQDEMNTNQVRSMVRADARWLTLAAWCMVARVLYVAVYFIFIGPAIDRWVAPVVLFVLLVALVVVTPVVLLTFLGANCLRDLRSFGLVVAGCIMAYAAGAFALFSIVLTVFSLFAIDSIRDLSVSVTVDLILGTCMNAALAFLTIFGATRALLIATRRDVRSAFRR